MASYLLQSRADNTVKKYQSSFDQFKSYCDINSLVSKPALPISVAMYFTSLLDQGKSDNVVSAAYYGIKWVHNINDLQDPTENSIVKQLLETAKRISSKPVQKKDVVSSEMLQARCLTYQDSVDIIDLRDLSMIMLAYAGFLRMNEVSNLHCNDVQFNSDHLVLKIRQSKTDVYRDGSEIVIAKSCSSACPYSMLQRYMSAAHLSINSDEYLFKPAFRSKHVASLIGKNKKLSYTRAKECIVDKLKSVAPGLKLGSHSLRASGATSVANTGVSDRCLKRHGRWKTDVAKDGYVKDSLEKRLSVTKMLKL
ncbi:uncharacterized protein LOC123561472 [Mercenaria mercenaria]|uniref:uncharacterized protein LOC123561472 n=1 Tax=Mercenaria mercenaria TaxID=6596 RepID=UPI001E1DC039|nr:uncharacterized protein LOC123561472 [Mercenaria mercenaria]